MNEFELKMEFDVSPQTLYDAWLDSAAHTEMTGGVAEIDPKVGGKHSAWDGYIWGEIIELEPGRRILQTWRTTEFAPTDADSLLELTFEPTDDGTLLTLAHANLPTALSYSYLEGWESNYFDPMEEYFCP